jgi:leucyl-tRNA synthetase
MWTKVLFDLGLIGHDEPYKRLVNQGMIQGSSRFVYRLLPTYLYQRDVEYDKNEKELMPVFISKPNYDRIQNGEINPADFLFSLYQKWGINKWFYEKHKDARFGASVNVIPVDVNIVDGIELDVIAFRKWKPEYKNAVIVFEDGWINLPGDDTKDKIFISGVEVEKMSKSKFNTVNPDDLVIKYGADTFRMYEMFLGPVEMSKPWDTKGIEGVHRFLRKLWRLFFDELKGKVWTEEKATDAELKVLHKTIKKIEEDTERFSFNTGVSTFMICVNDLTDLKCHKKEVLSSVLLLLTPYAPHIAEELWSLLGNSGSIIDAAYPKFEGKYIKETSKAYPVAINGKTRTELTLALDTTQQQVEEIVMADEIVKKWLEGKQPKKIIYVKNKMINVVV